jgi:hypothetical protein
MAKYHLLQEWHHGAQWLKSGKQKFKASPRAQGGTGRKSSSWRYAADASLPPEERAARVDSYEARTMQFLHRAVENGYRDVPDLKASPDWQLLRARADFQELIAMLVKMRKS